LASLASLEVAFGKLNKNFILLLQLTGWLLAGEAAGGVAACLHIH
jgi:hypothetical protein